MPISEAKSTLIQENILNLFNQVVQLKKDFRSLSRKELMISIYNSLDDKHEFNESVRIKLQQALQSVKPGVLDPNLVLSDGPFKGNTITWLSAYIAASGCSFPQQERAGLLGYPFFLRRLHELSHISGLNLSAASETTTSQLSALWLAVYADLRDLKHGYEWFTEFLVEKLNGEQLARLNVNAMGRADGIGCSVLAMMIKEDYASKDTPDYIHKLLAKVSPLKYPQFYDFNKKVIDKENMGMTTLCLAAQAEASAVKRDVPVSEKSAFVSIMKKADINNLDLNAPIIVGKNKGKTALWYAAYIATGQIYEGFDVIVEKADIDTLNLNAKAEDPKDDDANSSVLWLASFAFVNYRHGYPILTILRNRTDLSTLDFNNCPTTDKDGDKGKTVLWQCALAALNGQPGDDEALLIILSNSANLALDYGAKPVSGEYANYSVSSLIIQLAKEGNVMPLIKMLQDKNRPQDIKQQITPSIYATLCVMLRELSLDRDDLPDFNSLHGFLLQENMSDALLNEVVPCGEFIGQTVFMQVLELALDGYPQLLEKALAKGSKTLHGRESQLGPICDKLLSLKKMCQFQDIDSKQAQSMLAAYLSDRSTVEDYVKMEDSVQGLLVSFEKLQLQADANNLMASFDGKLKYTRSRWEP